MPVRRSRTDYCCEARLGTNPYKFGLVGSTDSHTGLSTAEEDNFFGKHSGAEPSPDRMRHPFTKTKQGTFEGWQTVASGLAAVWATQEHARSHLRRDGTARGVRHHRPTHDGALLRRLELYAGRPEAAVNRPSVVMRKAFRWVPTCLSTKTAKFPTFMVYALRDPIGANLDRIQIVKGWLDANGKTHEKVYDVIWSGNRQPREGWQAAPRRQYRGCEERQLDSTPSARRNSGPSGPIRISIQRTGPSITRACSKFPLHVGSSTTPSAMSLRSRRGLRPFIRNGPTPRRFGIHRRNTI